MKRFLCYLGLHRRNVLAAPVWLGTITVCKWCHRTLDADFK